MRTTLQNIITEARQHDIAFGAFSAASLEGAQAIVEAAQELRKPAILQYSPSHKHVMSLRLLGPALVRLADEADVPVCVHLDQSEDLDQIRQALDMGFTSVTAGGGSPADLHSRLRHLYFTCQVKELAERYQASVEGELGGTVESPDTDVEEAISFVQGTGVDVLSASFGTAHGTVAGDVHLECLHAIHDRIGVPVAIHGGSGLPISTLKECIHLGVRKINYYTAGSRAALTHVVQELARAQAEGRTVAGYEQITVWGREAFKAEITGAMKRFGLENI